jgi:alpha-tubulin suppressor-like RCC1 family protein
MKLWTACLVLSATSLLACERDGDSYIVVHSDVNCDVPRVFQLRITVKNNGLADRKTIPETPGAELGFPSSITLITSGPYSGSMDVLVEALDASGQIVGQGIANVILAPGGRTDVNLRIVAGGPSGTGVATSPGQAHGADGGTAIDTGVATTGPEVLAGSGVAFASVSAGTLGTCALRQDTSLWCWGNNTYGQLRFADLGDRVTPTEVSGTNWKTVSCAQTHACGIRQDGTLSCWGSNGAGQLGGASSTAAFQTFDFPDGSWQNVSAGSYYTCGVKADATLWCWGDNTFGQLGTGTGQSSSVPLQIVGTGFVQASSRFLHTCAVKQDGTLWCWGFNAYQQVGVDNVAPVLQPGQIAGSDWTKVATGFYHSCALKQGGSLWCWGGNGVGQLGSAAVAMGAQAKTSTPVQVTGTWATVVGGESYTCGIMSDQTLWCWGDNTHGQLGIASQTSQGTPAQVAPGRAFVDVSAGQSHTCAVSTDGSLWCWGDNTNGQLGIGSNQTSRFPSKSSSNATDRRRRRSYLFSPCRQLSGRPLTLSPAGAGARGLDYWRSLPDSSQPSPRGPRRSSHRFPLRYLLTPMDMSRTQRVALLN